jgi:hypothetical protein
MEMTKNGQVELDGVIIPYYHEGGEFWYPIKYVVEQFLLKGYNHISINDKYKNNIKRCVIDYSFKGTSSQETNCMNKQGWISYLKGCKLNKNKNENKINRYNIFCDYIGCDNKYNIITKFEYDDYMTDCINNVLESNKDIKFKKCLKCNREFPLHKNFFPVDSRVDVGFTGTCRMCKPSYFPIAHADTYARRVYSLYGNEAYLMYINNMSKFIEEYSNKKDFSLLCLHTNTTAYVKVAEKDALLNLIKSDFDNGNITENELNIDFATTNYKIKIKYNKLTNNEINEFVSNGDCKIRPWLYPQYRLGQVKFEIARIILNTYIKDNNIVINNIFDYNYTDLIKKCKLTQLLDNILDFIVKYYDYKYAGYKFNIASVNFYKDKNMRIFDMKWLIEKDLKIETTKIPLYITKTLLSLNYKTLYNILNKNYYEGNLFKWINECYPNNFVELDFNINAYRNKFDSLEEAQVDRILRNDCSNVIYNIRNSDNEISILDMKPDWIILSRTGTILVEYFGLYAYGGKEYKERLEIYKDKMRKKYIKYEKLLKIGYKHLYIYPDDLKNDFQGIHKKLKAIQ